jgi:sarcosine oxidase subunit beta
MGERFDAVVIGGGAIGASIALHLARLRFGRVALIERESLAAGSTGSSVASVDLLAQHAPVAELQVRSLHLFQHCQQVYGGECGWVQTGFALMGGSDGGVVGRAVAEVIRAAGGRISVMPAAGYRPLDPACSLEDAEEVLWVPEGGYLDPVLLTNTFAEAARAGGVTLRLNEPVGEIHQAGGRVSGVTTSKERLEAGVVVAAAGPWCARVARMAGLDLPLTIQRHAVAVLGCPPEAAPRTSIVDMTHMVYARPETGGLIVGGSMDMAVGYDVIQPGDPCLSPSMDYGGWVGERLAARYPGIANGQLHKGWSGPISMSPDSQPLLGRLPLDGLFCACGFSGAGLKIAPAVGERMAGLVAGDGAAQAALHALRPGRFADGEPLTAKFSWGTLA